VCFPFINQALLALNTPGAKLKNQRRQYAAFKREAIKRGKQLKMYRNLVSTYVKRLKRERVRNSRLRLTCTILKMQSSVLTEAVVLSTKKNEIASLLPPDVSYLTN
jgi:hypothetical protein